jgi:hypothetical protein
MAKTPKEEAHPQTAEQAKEPVKRRAGGGPVSLYPLTFEDAVDALLEVKMDPEKLKKPGAR